MKAAEVFARIDTDANGEITGAEFAAAELPREHAGPRSHRRHHRWGGDFSSQSDGSDPVGRRAEHEAALFEALDTDGDGQLSPAEFDREHQREVRLSLMKTRVFEHLDTDADGVLPHDEFPGRLARLKDLDANGNGEVSRDELRDGMRARHQQAT